MNDTKRIIDVRLKDGRTVMTWEGKSVENKDGGVLFSNHCPRCNASHDMFIPDCELENDPR